MADADGPKGPDPGELARHLIADAPFILAVVDAGGVITWVDGAVSKLTGYQRTEVLGTNILDHIDAAWSPRSVESVAFALTASGLQRPMLFRVRRKDGSLFVAEITANSQVEDPVVAGLAVYIRRWDERYFLDQVVESLAAGQPVRPTIDLLLQVMRAEILEADGVVFLEPVEGRFARSIPAAGMPSILAEDAGDPETPWQLALGRGEPDWRTVEELPPALAEAAAEQGYRWCWAWPVPGPAGMEGALVLWREADEVPDYTCTLAVESLVRITALILERERGLMRLRAQEKLASLGGLTAGIAHEIKNPANFIKNFSQDGIEMLAEVRAAVDGLVGGNPPSDGGVDAPGRQTAPAVEEVRERIGEGLDDVSVDLEYIDRHIDRVVAIVNSMLGHAHGDVGERTPTDVAELVVTYLDLGYHGFRSSGHESFDAHISFEHEGDTVADVYPEELGRVVLNLVGNACAAMSAKGTTDDYAPELVVRVARQASRIEISVRDNGTGIAPEHLGEIFQPFYTSKAPGEGTGLGLSMSHDIVAGLHGGELLVDSEWGSFSELKVVIPVDRPIGGEPFEVPPRDPGGSGGGERPSTGSRPRPLGEPADPELNPMDAKRWRSSGSAG